MSAGAATAPPPRLSSTRGFAGSWLAQHPVAIHVAVLAGYLAAGVVVTWPRAAYLTQGQLPATRDTGSYVWDFWWTARQVEHLANPWFTRMIAAPVGAALGYDALMPLECVLMMPVTILLGPSASYNLLSIAMPGLLSYGMYRVARMWLRSQVGAIAAGGFFGLSSMLCWEAFYHLNLAAGVLFLPIALEAAIRLRRRPGWRAALLLGAVLGASLLTDQESAILAGLLAGAALLPWLVQRPAWAKLRAAALAALVFVVVASPQLAAMLQQARSGGAHSPPQVLAQSYLSGGVPPSQMFANSPQSPGYGAGRMFALFVAGTRDPGVPYFGVVLTVLALCGLALYWRHGSARLLAALWLCCVLLALGPGLRAGGGTYVPLAENWHGVRVSALLPFTWFVQIPGLAQFREPSRLLFLGIVPAALLAGAAVDWLRFHARPLTAAVLGVGLLFSGNSGIAQILVMPTALPALDNPIAADHSGSIVVDVPFGIRSGYPEFGPPFCPEAQVLATADGHPRAAGYLSRAPASTIAGIKDIAFYSGLMDAQRAAPISPALIAAARRSAHRIDVGWVLVELRYGPYARAVDRYLAQTGYRPAYRADGITVYRSAPLRATTDPGVSPDAADLAAVCLARHVTTTAPNTAP